MCSRPMQIGQEISAVQITDVHKGYTLDVSLIKKQGLDH